MIVHDLILIAVWVNVLNDIVQGITHVISWVMLRHTDSDDAFSLALRHRELSLGAKSLGRTGYDLLIAISVTWSLNLEGSPIIPPIVILVAVTSLLAVVFAIRFLLTYWQENWGRPESISLPNNRQARQDERDVRQEHTQEVLDATSLTLAERGRNLSNAGISLDERVVDMSAERQNMDARDASQNKREVELVRIKDEAVPIPVAIEKVVETIRHIEQDVKTVRKKIVGEDTP